MISCVGLFLYLIHCYNRLPLIEPNNGSLFSLYTIVVHVNTSKAQDVCLCYWKLIAHCRPSEQWSFFRGDSAFIDLCSWRLVMAARWDVRGAESRWELWRNGRERKKKQKRGSCRRELQLPWEDIFESWGDVLKEFELLVKERKRRCRIREDGEIEREKKEEVFLRRKRRAAWSSGIPTEGEYFQVCLL